MAMRFGLVGTGFWAGSVHGPALAAHPGVELHGVWGRRPKEAERLATQLGATPYAEVEDMFSEVDAVAFAVPPTAQAPLAVAAARRGRHLLLEKPIALDPVEAEELVSTAEAAEIATMVFTTVRFVPEVEAWITHTAQRGGWQGLSGRWIGSIFFPGSPYLESTWRHEWGGLWDLGPHLLSITLPILGEPERIVATRGRDDLVQLDLVHAGGALSALTMTVYAPQVAEHTALEVWGSDGVSYLPDLSGIKHVEVYANAIDALLESVASGRRSHPCDVQHGLQTVSILAEAQRQLSPGRPDPVSA